MPVAGHRFGRRRFIALIVVALVAAIVLFSGAWAQAVDTLLLDAASHGSVSEMRVLVAIGADVRMPVMHPLVSRAVWSGNIDAVKYLVEKGAPLNRPVLALSPLQAAAKAGRVDMIQFLVANGESDLDRGIASAGENCHAAAFSLLKSLGAKPEHYAPDWLGRVRQRGGECGEIVKMLERG